MPGRTTGGVCEISFASTLGGGGAFCGGGGAGRGSAGGAIGVLRARRRIGFGWIRCGGKGGGGGGGAGFSTGFVTTATSRGTWWGARYVPGLVFATAMMM